MTTRDVSALFGAKSLAIVGASADPTKWGYWLSRGALSSDAEVALVNRGNATVLGHPTHASLADLPMAPDLVVFATPARYFEAELEAALAVGAKALVGITAGAFRDAQHGEKIVNQVREAGAVLLGPNCMGIADTARGLNLLWGELPTGPIGLLSQSGNLALEIGRLAVEVGLGVSRFASIGDQADLQFSDLLQEIADSPQTKVVALYVEDVKDGDAFGTAVADLTDSGMPVVILAAGGSVAGSRAASSHTGSMVSGDAVMDAVCKAAGAIRVRTPGELVDVCSVLVAGATTSGARTAVLADGGGHGIVASDVLEAAGFELPVLGTALQAKLAESLPTHASVGNPVDMAGGEKDLQNFASLVEDLSGSGEVNSVLLTGYFGAYGSESAQREEDELDICTRIGRARADSDVPVVVHSMDASSTAAAKLRSVGVPVFGRIENAVSALHLAFTASPSRWPKRRSKDCIGDGEAYWVARQMLSDRGVFFPEAHRVETGEAAVIAAEGLGYPVAVKVTGVDHKTEVGGVGLNLRSSQDVADFSEDLLSRMPGKALSVERMASHSNAVEIIVGARQDPRFGTVIMVGAGGIEAEIHEDIAIALGPVSEGEALAMLNELRLARRFSGFRGAPPLDVGAAAKVLVAVSEVADAVRDTVSDIEINPVLVMASGCLALDAHFVRKV